VNLVRRPAKRSIAATPAVNLSTISNVFEAAMTTFHSLTVAKVEPETRDAVTITFAVPQALQEAYRFRPGST
jgi:ring-1,2-phenylacetyl-CoA epoxidase subunit PaaE